MFFSRSDWLLNFRISSVIKFSTLGLCISCILNGSSNLAYQLIYLSLTLYGKRFNVSPTKRRKKVDSATFLPRKQKKKLGNAIPADRTLVWNDLLLRIFEVYLQIWRNYELNSSIRQDDYVAPTTQQQQSLPLKFSEWLASPRRSTFSKPLAGFLRV